MYCSIENKKIFYDIQDAVLTKSKIHDKAAIHFNDICSSCMKNTENAIIDIPG
jgi:hypothetical protein